MLTTMFVTLIKVSAWSICTCSLWWVNNLLSLECKKALLTSYTGYSRLNCTKETAVIWYLDSSTCNYLRWFNFVIQKYSQAKTFGFVSHVVLLLKLLLLFQVLLLFFLFVMTFSSAFYLLMDETKVSSQQFFRCYWWMANTKGHDARQFLVFAWTILICATRFCEKKIGARITSSLKRYGGQGVALKIGWDFEVPPLVSRNDEMTI